MQYGFNLEIKTKMYAKNKKVKNVRSACELGQKQMQWFAAVAESPLYFVIIDFNGACFQLNLYRVIIDFLRRKNCFPKTLVNVS